jgi:N6-adenosine-specific RNA methylase IME4
VTAYRCIVSDPPWAPRDKLPGKSRGAARQYPVMRTADIMAFLVDHQIVVADDAILFLWRLSSMQQDALDVAKAWGFDVKSEIIWQKLTANWLHHFGMGRTVRSSHETCLVCVRGRASKLIRGRNVRSTFSAKMPVNASGGLIHSAKPTEFFTQIVEPLIGLPNVCGPCLELFARGRRPNWDAIGNQLPALEAP